MHSTPQKKRRKGHLLVAAGLCTLLLAAVVQPSGAEESRNSGEVLAESEKVKVVQEGDLVRHDYAVDMPDSSVEIIQGERIESERGDQGCLYKGSDEEGPDGLSIGEVSISREIAHNQVTCELTLETAVMNETDAIDGGFLAVDKDGAQEAVESSGEGLTPNASTKGRYQKLYYEDPPQIDVTQVTVKVRWTYTGTCTTWSKHAAYWDWYWQSGWNRTSKWWGHDRSCTFGATTSNRGTYKNPVFCASVDTWNRYNTNYIQGKSNGAVHYEWDAQKWGGCTNLLSFHRATGNWSG